MTTFKERGDTGRQLPVQLLAGCENARIINPGMQNPTHTSVAWVFFRLGLLGFGGPVALVSLMEAESCRSRRWISHSQFSEVFVICKMLPGPVAFQMALWIGREVLGFWGGLTAGFFFLLPGATLILLFSVFYRELSQWRWAQSISLGMQLGALVVIWDSAVRLFKPYTKDRMSWCLLLLGFVFFWKFPSYEPAIILSGGLASIFFRHRTRLLLSPITVLFSLFWVHFQAGAFTFGTGLAIVPILQHTVVDIYHWMSAAEFLDGVALGQITPGPVTLTATFVGYRVAGLAGALSATAGMYLPGILMILGFLPHIHPVLKRSTWLAAFGAGATATVIGCIIGAAFWLAVPVLESWKAAALCFVLLILNIRFGLTSWKIVLLSAVLYAIVE